MVIIIPLLVALIGLLMWALSSNAKVIRIGEILMFVGTFWTVYATLDIKAVKLL